MPAPAISIQKVRTHTLLRQRGELVNYDTGSQLILDVKVVVTRPSANQIDLAADGSIVMEAKDWDVLIDPDTILDDNGVRIVPASGHIITRTGGLVLVVKSSAGGQPVWRWSDSMETWRRVHTTCKRER